MKKLLLSFLGLALVAAACQSVMAPTNSYLAGKQLAAPEPLALRLAATDSLSPAMRSFAQQHDLSALWQGQQGEEYARAGVPTVCAGFFGPDHYRIELVLLNVLRDAHDSLLYHVQGKDRYKKKVTAFSGDIRLQRLRRVYAEYLSSESQEKFARFYTACGEFKFCESGAAAGTFSGAIGIDFWQKPDSSLVVMSFWGNEHRQYANGGQLCLSGRWVSAKTGLHKDLLVGADLEELSRKIMPDFNIGERGFMLNPKYAKLGWNEYWGNEEWWADSPKPKLGL